MKIKKPISKLDNYMENLNFLFTNSLDIFAISYFTPNKNSNILSK